MTHNFTSGHGEKPSVAEPALTRSSIATRLKARLMQAVRREDGTAALDFVLVIPILLMIFMASFESGLLMVRHLMLEQAVDVTMRNLRIGLIKSPTAAVIKQEICGRSSILVNCNENIRIELTPVSWNFPAAKTECVDRSEVIQPSLNFNPGTANEVMLVRVCVVQDAMFPTTGVGLALPKDASGGYGLISVSAFVNEP